MPKLLSEKFVKRSIIEYLSRKGWGMNLRARELHEHGVDIKVRNNRYGRHWLIETKGDASFTAKSPKSHCENGFRIALGQIITRMNSNGRRGYKYRYKYGVGFPLSYKRLVEEHLPYDVCDKLNLYAFIVDQSGKVEEYDWKKLKRLQENGGSPEKRARTGPVHVG